MRKTTFNYVTIIVTIIALICDVTWSPYYREGFKMTAFALMITLCGGLLFRGLLAVISHVWDRSPIGGVLMIAFAIVWGGVFIHLSMGEYTMMALGLMYLAPSTVLGSAMFFAPVVVPALL